MPKAHARAGVRLLGGIVVIVGSVASAQDPQSTPIPRAPTTPEKLTATEPRDPYKELVAGLLMRQRYAAEGRPAVEVWDLMVGPGKTTQPARLPGAGVLEVRSGRGVLRVGPARPIRAGSARPLRTGVVLALDDTAEFILVNEDKETPLILRATVIRGAEP